VKSVKIPEKEVLYPDFDFFYDMNFFKLFQSLQFQNVKNFQIIFKKPTLFLQKNLDLEENGVVGSTSISSDLFPRRL